MNKFCGTVHPLDYVSMESWSGEYGGPWAPGSYSYDAWETYEDCGLCIWLREGCPEGEEPCDHYYLAEKMDLNLTTLVPEPGGNVAGTLTNVRFVEVDRRGNNKIVDGLTYCIDLWEFSGTFEDWSG